MNLLTRCLVVYLFTLFLGYNCFAQLYSVAAYSRTVENSKMPGDHLRWPDDRNYFEGSPYVFDDFIAGNMYAEGRLLYSQVPIRINLYNQDIEFLRNDSLFVLGPSLPVDQIILNGQIFLILDGKYNHVVEGIVKTWSREFPTVLTKMSINCLAASYKPYAEAKPQRFERVDRQFAWISEDKLIEVNTTKQLIKALGHQAQLTAFVKKNKISAQNPEQLTELLNHYRLLTEER